jgi:integrase
MERTKTKYPGIFKVGKGNKYYIRYQVGTKKYEKMVEGKLEDALKEKKERERRGKRGKYEVLERQEKTKFKELFKLYETEGEKKPYILQFKKVYEEFFGDLKLSQISRNDLFKFREKIKTTPKQRGGEEVMDSHVNRALAGLRRLFHFAIARELMEESMNPFPRTPKSGLFYPEKRGRRNFFTEDQIIKIYNGAPDWMKPLIAISFYTGMRMGEVRKLRWEHVNVETGIIQLPESKTLKDPSGVGQRIVMQKELTDLFKTLPKRSDDWVFVRADGLPYQHWDIHKPFKALLKTLGIDADKFSWKDIRHTTGTLLHLKGADPLAIKDQLRHTTIQTTESFYIGSDVEYQRSQIERLSLKKEEATA